MYLEQLAGKGFARGMLRSRAAYCLYLANEIDRWPPDHIFDEDEIDALTSQRAAQRTGRASGIRRPKEPFQFAATDFLRSFGRLRAPPLAAPGKHADKLADFIGAHEESRWISAETRHSVAWHVRKFLDYIEHREAVLEDVTAVDVDAYFGHAGQRWNRNTLRTSGTALRAWFAHCEARGWMHQGLASAVLLPRIYRHEGLPLGPTWDEVGRLLTESSGDRPADLRNHAILLLLSVYGVRSGEVRRLRVDDLDWRRERIRVVRSKTRREEMLPLEPRVGNAIARYLREGRPKSDSRIVFLTLRPPARPLTASALYDIVESRLTKVSSLDKARGPHGLRHACARHLLEAGRSFKEIGDHLGHRSPDVTRIYAKVDLGSLRRVALDDLGSLA